MFLRSRVLNPFLKRSLFKPAQSVPRIFSFGKFSTKDDEAAEIDWDALDRKAIVKIFTKNMESEMYHRIQDQWQKPLARKQAYRARKLERDAKREPMPEETQKFVVHPGTEQITYPQDPYGIFAIVQIGGKQYKVTKDCTVMLEKTPFEVGDQIVIDQVVMVGTKEYTSIGRPFVETAKVYATVEEESKTEKVIIFKKRRRKTFQKNQGHRQTVHNIRVDGIEHGLETL